MLDAKQRRYRFQGSRSAQRVSEIAFIGRYGDSVRGLFKHVANGCALANVVAWGSGAVGVYHGDFLWIDLRVFQSLAHGCGLTSGAGTRDVRGIRRFTVSKYFAENRRAALLRWTLPQLLEIAPDPPPRLLVASAGAPMWRGGSSGLALA